MKVLVVASWEPELARFRDYAGANAGGDVRLETLGVGVVEASLGMARALAADTPELALLVGTAGALPTERPAKIGGVVAAARIRIVDAGLLAGDAALPPPLPAVAEPDARVLGALVQAGAARAEVANTIGITTSDTLAAAIAAAGNEIEHLEAFAFARACARAGVPCGVVLGVANTVGSRGRGEWLANHVSASAAAGEFLWRALPAVVAAIRPPVGP